MSQRSYQQTVSSETILEIAERAAKFRTTFTAMEKFLDRGDSTDFFILDYDDVVALVAGCRAIMHCARQSPAVQETMRSMDTVQ